MPIAPDNRQYTLIVVSDHSQAVRKFRLQRAWLKKSALGGGALLVVGLLTITHYFTLLSASSENRVLKEENAQLKSQVLLVQEKVAHVQATLDRVERFDAKLRSAVTHLQDPERNLAIGPVGAPDAAPAGAAPAARENPAALPGRIASLEGEAHRQEASLRELHRVLRGPEVDAGLHPLGLADPGLGDERLRLPARPVQRRPQHAPGARHRHAARAAGHHAVRRDGGLQRHRGRLRQGAGASTTATA